MSDSDSTPEAAPVGAPSAEAGEHHGHGDHSNPHVCSMELLWGVFIALCILTVVTVLVAAATPSIVIAMAIAFVKASLVVLFFMHLKYDKPFNAVVFVTSVGLLGLFLGMTTLDTSEYAWSTSKAYGEKKMQLLRDKELKDQQEAEDKAAKAEKREAKKIELYPRDHPFVVDPEVKRKEMVAKGKKLYESLCKVCHNLDGKAGVGPTFKDLFGSKRKVVYKKNPDEVVEITVDEAYLRESVMDSDRILSWNAKLDTAYTNQMVAQQFPTKLKGKKLDQIVEFLKTLKKQ